MGFFAVTSRLSQVSYAVKACHLSLWVLAKPWYHGFGYKFFWDVGLRILPEGALRRIRVALPFDTASGDITDLSEFVLNPDFSPLIFGRPVEVVGDRLRYDAVSINQETIDDRVVAVSTTNSTPESETKRDVGFSIWTVEFEKPLNAGETAYVRFRLPIRNPWRIWFSKGWGLAKRGAIADLRIADVRESLLLGEGKREAEHIQPVDQVFLFVIAPSYFVPKHVSPILHYSRLMEPRVWNRYLTSCGEYDGSTKFSIHQWRSSRGSEAAPIIVNADNPFRVYADFSREFGSEILFYYILGGMSFPLLGAASKALFDFARSALFY